MLSTRLTGLFGVIQGGEVQDLIHDVPTVRELVDRTITEAEGLTRGRLGAMIVADAPVASLERRLPS